MLLQSRHESDWNITLCVVLVSPYSVQEFPSPNCTIPISLRPKVTGFFKAIRKDKKQLHTLLCYGFFSVDIK